VSTPVVWTDAGNTDVIRVEEEVANVRRRLEHSDWHPAQVDQLVGTGSNTEADREPVHTSSSSRLW
jgi:hypothetical protein